MKNKLLYILSFMFLLSATSCKKDITGNAITIEANANDTVIYFGIYNSCLPGPGSQPSGYLDLFDYLGNGNYHYEIEKGYDESCFTITGTIPKNQDSTGNTIVNVKAFYTEEGNVVGFQDLEIKRPHGEQYIKYEFRPDTYIE